MNILAKIHAVQKQLVELKLDGWLLYDFRRSNRLACSFLEIPDAALLTRRFFYWIPASGNPVKIMHCIEAYALDRLPGEARVYGTWQELDRQLRKVLKGECRIAMEYSPCNAIPSISQVDAGTIEVVRNLGLEIVSSGNILQRYTAVWDEEQLKSHYEAAEILDQCAASTWELISHSLKSGRVLTEVDVQQFIVDELARQNCIASDRPICAVNEHSADPHYSPGADASSFIKPGDFILIDLWCKRNLPRSVYADITRVGIALDKPTEEQERIFSIVRSARDAALAYVKSNMLVEAPICGWQVDKVCRDVIEQAGYGAYFTHRTGHSIGEADHGVGANIDNYETHDDRELIPGTCFSIEPGIYLPGKFGVRLEYDVVIHPDRRVEVTGGIQESIKTLLCDVNAYHKNA